MCKISKIRSFLLFLVLFSGGHNSVSAELNSAISILESKPVSSLEFGLFLNERRLRERLPNYISFVKYNEEQKTFTIRVICLGCEHDSSDQSCSTLTREIKDVFGVKPNGEVVIGVVSGFSRAFVPTYKDIDKELELLLLQIDLEVNLKVEIYAKEHDFKCESLLREEKIKVIREIK